MGTVEIAFERIREIFEEEAKWKLFCVKHEYEFDETKKEMIENKLRSLEEEKELLIRSIRFED